MPLFRRDPAPTGALDPESVRNVLSRVPYPGFTRSLVSFGLVKDVTVEGSRVHIALQIARPDAARDSAIERSVRDALAAAFGDVLVAIDVVRPEAPTAPVVPTVAAGPPPGLEMGAGPRPHGADPWASRAVIEGVRHVVAVASGKGGVGKSTVAVNLALALMQSGMQTGLLDLDVYGPSIPTMLGLDDTPEVEGQDTIVPLPFAGMKVMSIGFLLGDDAPVIWRGPMVMQLVMQFLRKVRWAPLDVLVIDLPPGTGDTQLTLVQNVPLDGAIVVTTPSDVALIDVRRAMNMFAKVETPILGVVENMSAFVCPHCHETSYVFSHGGGERVAREVGVPFLGEIPLHGAIRAGGDEGRPVMLARPESDEAAPFARLAEKTRAALAARTR